MAESSQDDLFSEPPKGPLTVYRNQATFDWKKLKLVIDSEDIIRYKNRIYKILQEDKIFNHPLATAPLDEQRRLALNRFRALKSKNTLSWEDAAKNPLLPAAWNEAVFMYDASMGTSYSITYFMFVSTIKGLGTTKHDTIISAADKSEITGCFALTEVSHGSNAKGMRTTATFDAETNEFVFHSADFGAAKCWAGLMGKCATHALTYAKLVTPDGVDHGLHAFVVPIRCTHTLKPFAGVIVGDIGEKIGLNGIDNGFLMFNSYRVSSNSLLDRLGSVDTRGNYDSLIKDPNRRLAASFAILSGGRVTIGGVSNVHLQKAVTVAVRYSAVRKQFGPDESNEELAVLEYQQQQIRILPYLAAAFVMRVFSNWFQEKHVTHSVVEQSMDISKSIEIHGLSSATKPVISWLVRDGLQVCREACGGHGYLKAAGFGDLRGDNDANCTYEGENSLLVQQTSNWLLSLWSKLKNGKEVISPFKTVDFLNDSNNILQSKMRVKETKDILNPNSLLLCYKWLVCYSLEKTANKVESLKKLGKDSFTVRNETQAYLAATLSVLYAEHSIFDTVHKFVLNIKDQSCREVMMKLLVLNASWSLEKHLSTLYMGKFLSENAGELLREGIVELCGSIKREAVALVDVIAPPDFILNSVLGNSDGYVYENMQAHIFLNPEAMSRPSWWQDVVNYNKIPSKI